MADKKIQDITESTTLTGNEETYAISGTSDIRIKLSTLKSWILTGFSVAFSAIYGKPTTIGGYGITDAYTSTQVDSALSGKANASHGHSSSDISDLAEAVQDAMNTALAHGNHTGCTVTYDDANNRFVITASGGGGLDLIQTRSFL